jgi:hypothetical protein
MGRAQFSLQNQIDVIGATVDELKSLNIPALQTKMDDVKTKLDGTNTKVDGVNSNIDTNVRPGLWELKYFYVSVGDYYIANVNGGAYSVITSAVGKGKLKSLKITLSNSAPTCTVKITVDGVDRMFNIDANAKQNRGVSSGNSLGTYTLQYDFDWNFNSSAVVSIASVSGSNYPAYISADFMLS